MRTKTKAEIQERQEEQREYEASFVPIQTADAIAEKDEKISQLTAKVKEWKAEALKQCHRTYKQDEIRRLEAKDVEFAA